MSTHRTILLVGVVAGSAICIVLAFWLLTSRTPITVSLSATGVDALPESIDEVVLRNLTLIHTNGDEVRLGGRFSLERSNGFAVTKHLTIPEGQYTAVELQFELEGEANSLSLGVPKNTPQNAPLALHTTESAASALLIVVDVNRSIVRRESNTVFLPVIRIETRESIPSTVAPTEVVEGGVIRTNATFGTTEYGTLKQNYVAR